MVLYLPKILLQSTQKSLNTLFTHLLKIKIKNKKNKKIVYPILYIKPQPFNRFYLITLAIKDNIMELFMRVPTHYFNKIQHWIFMNYNI